MTKETKIAIVATLVGTAILCPLFYLDHMANETRMTKLGYSAGYDLPNTWSELAQWFMTPYMIFPIIAFFSGFVLVGVFIFRWARQKSQK
jgi:hypothetical protein